MAYVHLPAERQVTLLFSCTIYLSQRQDYPAEWVAPPSPETAVEVGFYNTSGSITGGYRMFIGNPIPWNVPPDAGKRCLDLCDELAYC